jgi:hypothetical protein
MSCGRSALPRRVHRQDEHDREVGVGGRGRGVLAEEIVVVIAAAVATTLAPETTTPASLSRWIVT